MEHGESRYSDDDIVYRITHGLCHADTISPVDIKKKRKHHYNPDKAAEDAKICLNCPFETCEGSESCFARRKKEIKNTKNIKEIQK